MLQNPIVVEVVKQPEIQAKFKTPERFLTMVRTSYQPVYRPRQVVFRDVTTLRGQPTQAVLLVGPDGVPF